MKKNTYIGLAKKDILVNLHKNSNEIFGYIYIYIYTHTHTTKFVCIYKTKSLCYAAEINTTLQINYISISFFFLRFKGKNKNLTFSNFTFMTRKLFMTNIVK